MEDEEPARRKVQRKEASEMKISIVSVWYNEAFLAPFFLEHYRYADEILIFVDADTDDKTVEICSRYPNTRIEKIRYPDGYNCRLQTEKVNEAVPGLDCDWVICVDADELLFPEGMGDTRKALAVANGNLIFAQIWQVYRHAEDSDLDANRPAVVQRRHGDPNTTRGINGLYNKPIITKPSARVAWKPGFHAYFKNDKVVISDTVFKGAHWQMADIDLAIQRRIKGQRNRQSRENLNRKWARQHHYITEEAIRSECERHLHDPKLF